MAVIRPLRPDPALPAARTADGVAPVPLDRAIEIAAAEADPATLAQIERFEAMLRAADAAEPHAEVPSLSALLADFAMPSLHDPMILARSAELLAAIGADLAETGSTDAVLVVGSALIRDELRKQRLLQQNRNGLIEA